MSSSTPPTCLKTPISPPTCWRCQESRSFPSTCLEMPKNPKGPPSQHARRCQEPPQNPSACPEVQAGDQAPPGDLPRVGIPWDEGSSVG